MKFKSNGDKNREIYEDTLNDMAKQGWIYKDNFANGSFLVFER